MPQIETTRLKDLIALRIGAVQAFAEELTVNKDVKELVGLVVELEVATAELKSTLKAIPHNPDS